MNKETKNCPWFMKKIKDIPNSFCSCADKHTTLTWYPSYVISRSSVNPVDMNDILYNEEIPIIYVVYMHLLVLLLCSVNVLSFLSPSCSSLYNTVLCVIWTQLGWNFISNIFLWKDKQKSFFTNRFVKFLEHFGWSKYIHGVLIP